MTIRPVSALSLLFLFVLVHNAEPQSQPSADDFRLSVSVDLVALQATVVDQKGSYVSNLQQQDFEVYEDGIRQTIGLFRHEDVPVTVGLVIDHSGSMRLKLNHVTAAARAFVQSSNPQDEMFVVNFNERVTMGLPAAIHFTESFPMNSKPRSLRAPATGRRRSTMRSSRR